MKAIDALLPVALLGTARSGDVPAAIRRIPGVANEILATLADDGDAPAHTLVLRAAAVLGHCQRVGFVVSPPSAPAAETAGADTPPLDTPPLDAPPLDGGEWLARLEHVLDEGPPALQWEVLRTIAARGYRLHARLLPQALDLAVRDASLREVVGSVLGARGRWLAGRRRPWGDALAAATSPTEADWQHGRVAARAAFLRHERSHAPDVARERLVGELAQLGADERAELVSCLAVALGPGDEMLLQALLVDRAVEVRRTAARLLLRLPESARSRAIVGALGALMGTSKTGAWTIDAPNAEPPGAKVLGLEPRPKSDELGERAFWLFQLVRNAPLSSWTTRTGLPPREVVAWAARTDWSDAVLRGIHDAVLVTPDSDWAKALLDGWVAKALGKTTVHIRSLLPWNEREAAWRAQLEKRGAASLLEVFEEMTEVAGPTDRLSPQLAAVVVRLLASCLGSLGSPFDARERDALLVVCAALPDAALAQLQTIRRDDRLPPQLDESVDRVEQLVELRLRLRSLGSPIATPASPSPPRTP